MKKLSVFFIVLGLFTVGGYLFIRYWLQRDLVKENTPAVELPKAASPLDLRPLLLAKLRDLVRDGSNGLYRLSIDSVQIDVLNATAILIDVRMDWDTSRLAVLDSLKEAPDNLYTLAFDTLYIDGLSLDDIITRKTIDLRTIRVAKPVMEVLYNKRGYNKRTDTLTLQQRLSNGLKRLAIDKVEIDDGIFISRRAAKKGPTRLSDISLLLTNILFDSTTRQDTSRFLFAEEAVISGKSIQLPAANGLYQFKVGSFSLSAARRTLTAAGVSFLPQNVKNKKAWRGREQYSLHIPRVAVQNIAWPDLLTNGDVRAGELTLTNGDVQVYLNRSWPPPKSKIGNYPHQLVMRFPFRLHVDRLNLNNIDLTYEEFNPLSGKTGKLIVNRIQGQAVNIVNDPAHITQYPLTVITATGRFMNKTSLDATIRLNLSRHKEGRFTASLKTGALDNETINTIAEPLGLLRLDKGTVQSATSFVEGANNTLNGRVLLLYNDLNISLLKKKSGDKPELAEKDALSFLANRFVIKNHNPAKGEPPRRVTATFNRTPANGFINVIWKTTFVGVLKTIGAPQKLANPPQ